MNLAQGTANARVLAGNTTNQTIVTYTDALSTVKLCKEWTGSSTPTTSFPFTVSSSGPAGPTAVTGTVGLTATSCQIVGTVRAGTVVNFTEGVVPGTKVASISVSPTTNSQGISPIVPGSLSLPNRTVSVIAGAGETDVTYTDENADPGTLKICLDPTSTVTAGTVPFTVNGTQTIDVNLSSTAIQCTLDPTTFAFDGPVTHLRRCAYGTGCIRRDTYGRSDERRGARGWRSDGHKSAESGSEHGLQRNGAHVRGHRD